MIGHGLTETERAGFEARLLDLERRERSADPRYGLFEAELSRVAEELAEHRRNRSAHLREVINKLKAAVEQTEGEIRAQSAEFIEGALRALEREDLALAEEYTTLIEGILRSNRLATKEPEWTGVDEFERFHKSIPELIKALDDDDRAGKKHVRKKLTEGGKIPGLDMSSIPGARYKEIAAAVDAFYGLKGTHGAVDPRTDWTGSLAAILRYLGFVSPRVTRKNTRQSYWHYSAEMSDGGFSPLPQFGSDRKGVYDVLVVWDRPSADSLGQLVQEAGLNGRSPVVLFMGRMPLRQREDWGAFCLRRQLTVLLVDELLIYYLASVRSHRLAPCVACSMPWGYVNPYTPFGAGNVPPEMFRGRSDVISDLWDPNRTAIIYGGRQLGKSAVLRAVERRFNRPEARQFVFLNDIKNLGDPEGNHPVSEVWQHIKEWAASIKLVDSKVLDTANNVSTEMLRALAKYPDARILILLDEADNFLKADAKSDFIVVQQLKKLMDSSERRIKFVFSGLHGVQRFCSIPNHPFAHLQSVNIGPLEPDEALALVREPLSMLGFEFQDNDAIYRILAYTNYHPALIQHFCSELVKARRNTSPPYSLTLKMIEDVYRNPEVRQVMRERFEWTVALDPRYEMLVYAMILEQSSAGDGYRQEMRVRDILDCARQWQNQGGFLDGATPEEAKSLLQELVGLGVLIWQEERATFRLRNANVVRAFGSEDDIWDRIQELSKNVKPVEYDPRNLRADLDIKAGTWSPLTLAQEGALLKGQTGVGLVFGSEALGFGDLPLRLKRLVSGPGEGTDSSLVVLPPECVSVGGVQSFLETRVFNHDSGKHVLSINGSHLWSFDKSPGQALLEIQALLRKRRAKHRTVHCVFTFDAAATSRWFSRPEPERSADEDAIDAVVTLGLWDSNMVERFIRASSLLDIGEVKEKIATATGGWPFLVQELFRNLHKEYGKRLDHVDPRRAADQLGAKLKADEDGVATRFLEAAGALKGTYADDILKLVGTFETLDPSDVTPENLGRSEASLETIASEIEYLARLGLLTLQQGVLTVDPTVRRALGL